MSGSGRLYLDRNGIWTEQIRRLPANNATTVLSNNITSLFVDKQGSLWVGTGIGLMHYNSDTEQFERLTLPCKALPRINDIIQEDDRHLLIGTAGYGLFRVNTVSRKAEQVENYAQGDLDYFNHILIDDEGNFWKGGSGADFTCRRPDKSIRYFSSPYGPVTAFVNYQGGVLMVCQRGYSATGKGICLSERWARVFVGYHRGRINCTVTNIPVLHST